LTIDGGIIEVDVNDSSDDENLQLIRRHLKEIAAEFQRGIFQKALATHNEVPPGVLKMQQLQLSINYAFSESARGAFVRISSSNGVAVAVIQDCLRYQIREHATRDQLTVEK